MSHVSEYALSVPDASGFATVPRVEDLDGPAVRTALAAPALPSPVLEQTLVRLGLSPEDFAAACRAAERNGSSPDEELIAAGLVDPTALADGIGAALGLGSERIGTGASLLRDGRGAFDAAERHAKTCDGAMRARLFLAPRLDRLDTLAERLVGRRTWPPLCA